MNKTSSWKYAGVIVASGAVLAALTLGSTAFADTTLNVSASMNHQGRGGWGAGMNMGGKNMPGVFGTVSAISGTTLTITSKAGPRTENGSSAATPITYTVNAGTAVVTKDNATSSLSSVTVGDTVMVMGTVSGTTVTATSIHDGMGMMMGGMRGDHMKNGTSTPITITGNGQPVVAGTVSTISGSTITITNKSNVTYTIDASSAKFQKAGVSAAVLSNIAVGDSVIVQGTVNGTAIVAVSVIDQGIVNTSTSQNGNPQPEGGPMGAKGIFAGIGAFLHRIFGF